MKELYGEFEEKYFSVVLDLSNDTDSPRGYRLFGSNLNLPVVKQPPSVSSQQLPYDPQRDLRGTTDLIINSLVEGRESAAIGHLSDPAYRPAPQLEADLALAEQVAKEKPIRINRIKIITDRAEQLRQEYFYFYQDAAGNLSKDRLNVLQHYNPEGHPYVDIGKQYLGTPQARWLVLDGSRRLEVDVLARTKCIVELIYEPDQGILKNNRDLREIFDGMQASGRAGADLDVLQEYVDHYFDYAKLAQTKAGIPVLFSLAKAALETGYDLEKPGNALFPLLARDDWKGKSQILPGLGCNIPVQKAAPAGKKNQKGKAPRVSCAPETVQAAPVLYRAYPSPTHSILDYARTLAADTFQKSAFSYQDDPYEFARRVAGANFEKATPLKPSLQSVMQLLEPYVAAYGESPAPVQPDLSGEFGKQTVVFVASLVLVIVLFSTLLKFIAASK